VHIVPHTHDDAGWLKTVDEYYAGQNNTIQHAGVHYILDSVIRNLAENPDRKFVYVEQAFFARWWREQSEKTQNLTRQLVKNGQLQMINGAWVMHCEATPHYLDMIDQTRLGHTFLMKEFGILPKIGWQIDPFGHSATQAALLSAEVGFVGLFFGRIDYQDLALRVNQSAAEFVWRASPSLGPQTQVFTGLTGEYGGNYGPPAGFNWDHSSNDEPIQDDPDLENYNVQSRIDDFVKASLWQASHTKGHNILMTMGSDFQYEAAGDWYSNLDKLIHYLNKDGRVNAFYSNPEMYVAAKAKEDVAWPLKTDDFFPYADGPHQFWTGYFTSRPDLKRFVRDSSAFFQISKQILALGLPKQPFSKLETLAEAMGLLQHHDAIAGTEKQHTAFDYAKRLARARSQAEVVASSALAALSEDAQTKFSYCVQRNVSICEATQHASGTQQPLSFVVWNGLAQERIEVVELPVEVASSVIDLETGATVPSQIVHALPSITNYGEPAQGAALTLIFEAKLPALGFKSYRLQANRAAAQSDRKQTNDDVVLENEYLKITICGDTGKLCSIADKESGIRTRAVQDWYWYTASIGNDESKQASGAYIFRPNRSEAEQVFKQKPSVEVSRGDLADEVIQHFGSVVYQRFRLAKGSRHLEHTYTVSALPIADGWGKEIVSRISTDISNAGECYTDSNGREMQYRKRNYRATWKLNQTEPTAGNYFPVGTSLFIKDSKAQLTVLTDAVQAGTGCVNDGAIELMVDRRLLKDDERGVGEPLNETEFVMPYYGANNGGEHYGAGLVVRGQHFITLAPPSKAAGVWRPLQDRVYIKAVPFFANSQLSSKAAVYSALAAPLPPNVQIITLETVEADIILLRLAHQFGLDEDATLSKPATVSISKLFAGRSVRRVEELALTGTAPRSEVVRRRIAWKIEGENERIPLDMGDDGQSTSDEVELGPLQIKTFRVSFGEEIAIVV